MPNPCGRRRSSNRRMISREAWLIQNVGDDCGAQRGLRPFFIACYIDFSMTLTKKQAGSMPPRTSADFDSAYRLPFTPWGDFRIPGEIVALVAEKAPRRVLELGCGLGRFSRYVARQGVTTTGIDFSPVAIAKARASVARDRQRPEFMVGDVTQLDDVHGPFDVSFDVGCFHCLDSAGQRKYASEVLRLLAPGGIHLIWALDDSPGGPRLSPSVMQEVFTPGFQLSRAHKSRRRLGKSHWYWLQTQMADTTIQSRSTC
jgi:SAM-dependent methyltransferase